jgi:hypothetical protein
MGKPALPGDVGQGRCEDCEQDEEKREAEGQARDVQDRAANSGGQEGREAPCTDNFLGFLPTFH